MGSLDPGSTTLAMALTHLFRHETRVLVLELSQLHELDANGIDAVADALTVAGLRDVECVVVAPPRVRPHFDAGGVFASVRVAANFDEAVREAERAPRRGTRSPPERT